MKQPRQPSPAVPEQPGGADRVIRVLKAVARHPRGATLDELTMEVGSPKPSVHRALSTLVRSDLVDQEHRGGSYRLSLEFVRIAFSFYEEWDEQDVVRPVLDALARRFGEATHYARLDGGEVVYIAKISPPVEGVRMTSIIGGRNPAHCTGVGKVLLAHELPDLEAVRSYAATYGPLVRRTENTISDVDDLHGELGRIRRTGYALDREESEIGINCIAFPVYFAATRPAGAISVSAVAQRTPLTVLRAAAPEIRTIIAPITPP